MESGAAARRAGAALQPGGLVNTAIWQVELEGRARTYGSQDFGTADPSAVLRCSDTAESYLIWPHKFQLTLTITLRPDSLEIQLTVANGSTAPRYRPPAVALAQLSEATQWRMGQSFAFTTAIRHHLKLDTAQLAVLLDSLELRANGRGSSVHEIESASEPGATGESDTSGQLWSPQSKPAAEMTMEVCPAPL